MEALTQCRNSLRLVGLLAATLVAVLAAPASAATNTQAAQQAINFLSADVDTWMSTQGSCAACHRVGAALYGVSSAKSNGYDMTAVTANGRTNQANLDAIAQRTIADQSADGGWSRQMPGSWPNTTTSYAAFGIAGYDAFVNTQYSSNLVSAAQWAMGRQEASGRWFEEFQTLPTQWGNGPVTARMMVALGQARQRVDPATASQFQASLDKAAAYLIANLDNLTTGADGMGLTQQMSWAIVGLKAAGPGANGEHTAAITTLADRILTRTSASAGWGDVAGAQSNEFDTGLAIYALCLAGRDLEQGGRLQNAIEWLKSRQNVDGSFGTMGTVRDIPTTFASLGLSCFGDHNVQVFTQPERQVVEYRWPTPQTATYVITVKNHGYQPDTYDLSALGGLPGWTSVLSAASLALAPGEEAQLTLTVTVPPQQFPALSSEVSVVAVSRANPGVKGSARVLTYTNPPPPVTGWDTVTTLTAPALGSSVALGQTVNLSARVNALDPNGPTPQQAGPDRGVVTFFVAGVAIGADNDADGDGVFTVAWSPTRASWSSFGEQDFRAVYSGVTLQPDAPNLKGSVAAGTLFIETPPAPVELDTSISIVSPAAGGTLLVGGNPAMLSARVRIHNANGTTSQLAGPSKGSVTFSIAGVAVGTDEDADGDGLFALSWGPARNLWSALGEQPFQVVYSGVTLQPDAPNLKGSDASQTVLIRIAPDVVLCNITNPYQKSTTLRVCGFAQAKEKNATIVYRAFTLNGGAPVFVTPSASNVSSGLVEHTFSTLREGANVIEFTAQDSFGSVTTRSVTVYVDNVAPELTVLSPTQGQQVRPGEILVTAAVVDSSPVDVRAGFGAIRTVPAGGGTVTVSVTITALGNQTFTVTAKDKAGNETKKTVQVKVSNSAPLAASFSPEATPRSTETRSMQAETPSCLRR